MAASPTLVVSLVSLASLVFLVSLVSLVSVVSLALAASGALVMSDSDYDSNQPLHVWDMI